MKITGGDGVYGSDISMKLGSVFRYRELEVPAYGAISDLKKEYHPCSGYQIDAINSFMSFITDFNCPPDSVISKARVLLHERIVKVYQELEEKEVLTTINWRKHFPDINYDRIIAIHGFPSIHVPSFMFQITYNLARKDNHTVVCKKCETKDTMHLVWTEPLCATLFCVKCMEYKPTPDTFRLFYNM